jgi:hypothetical protein
MEAHSWYHCFLSTASLRMVSTMRAPLAGGFE